MKKIEDMETKLSGVVKNYLDRFGVSLSYFENKSILEMGCGSGEFIQYLLDNKITDKAWGLDSENNQGGIYDLKINKDNFLHQDYNESIGLKDLDLIFFKDSIYPNKVSESIEVFKKLRDNLSENGVIKITVFLKDEEHLLAKSWKEVIDNLDESGLEWDIDTENEVLIIKK